MNIIKEENGVAIIEIDNAYYVVEINRDQGQVYSIVPSDSPCGGGQWYGAMSEPGVKYVASGRSKSAAFSAYRRVFQLNYE
jgi:hypothetical protein